ncbi:MAG TPA: TetR/AcrR family transcriptional regulator [Chthoniobacterales bacterium]|nr:TetR/AcrR family transcriptional regulator [Chthoniobacterales bacterium]
MKPNVETRSARKRRAILEAATSVFLEKGYDGTSMDDVATLAAVSKPTVYKHFADKEQLFAEIIRTTANQVDDLIRLVAETLVDPGDVENGLTELARRFITALMQPQMLRLRRLVIANADRFPDVGRIWYELGFERVLATLASCFQRLAQHQLLRLDDPVLAANHFVGLLLWIPLNKAMFSGEHHASKAELERYARAAAHAFLGGYGRSFLPASSRTARGKRPTGKKSG